MIFTFLNPAGGLSYHCKALLYSRTLWRPFSSAIGVWLRQWQPPEKKLIIIGPSGGYTLQHAFLQRFEKIVAVDPDPLSEWIFRRRFASCSASLQWDTRDYFIETGGSEELFCGFLASAGDAAVLFANFLGQMPFLLRAEKERERVISFWHENLSLFLEGRSWASFHDRYSTRRRPLLQGQATSPERLSGEALIKRYYGADARGEWVDHQTGRLVLARDTYDYFLWELTPRAFHIIEAIFTPNTKKKPRVAENGTEKTECHKP